MPPSVSKSAIWLWAKVGLCLVLMDLLLFRVGLLWLITPNFGTGLGAENWRFLYAAARAFETQRPAHGSTIMIGSSVVVMGVDETLVNAQLSQKGVPPVLRLVTHGSLCTDSAVLAWNSLPTHPWLVIYGAAFRDFPKASASESQIVRMFYDSSAELPLLPRKSAEAALDARVKRYWKLYRYRFFARTAVQNAAADLVATLPVPRLSFAADTPQPPLPRDATRYFSPYRITPQSYAAWDRWRQSRRFADYVEWMRLAGSMALHNYKLQTLASFGPEGNPQVESLRWMLGFLRQQHTRAVIVSFPENPVFHDPEAKPYLDPALSDAYAALFKREAATSGARYVDLRSLLDAEDFYDLIHPNLEGVRKLSARLAAIIEDEWQLRQEAGAQ